MKKLNKETKTLTLSSLTSITFMLITASILKDPIGAFMLSISVLGLALIVLGGEENV